MIDLRDNTLNHRPITKWTVEFLTVRGFHTDLREALVAAEETEMTPEAIRTIPMAHNEAGEKEPRFI